MLRRAVWRFWREMRLVGVGVVGVVDEVGWAGCGVAAVGRGVLKGDLNGLESVAAAAVWGFRRRRLREGGVWVLVDILGFWCVW